MAIRELKRQWFGLFLSICPFSLPTHMSGVIRGCRSVVYIKMLFFPWYTFSESMTKIPPFLYCSTFFKTNTFQHSQSWDYTGAEWARQREIDWIWPQIHKSQGSLGLMGRSFVELGHNVITITWQRDKNEFSRVRRTVTFLLYIPVFIFTDGALVHFKEEGGDKYKLLLEIQMKIWF